MRHQADDRVIHRKLQRARSGAALRILDLFAGCGGLFLGFHAAGCRVAGAVESDPLAARSHSQNFHGADAVHAKARDITATDPATLVSELGLGETDDAVDVIIGGPPCQAYARVGRAKLREVAAHPHAYQQDPRSDLYLRYLRYVRDLHPVGLLVENVPDVLNYGGHNVAEEIPASSMVNEYVNCP